jgi:hypothetical protein
MKKFIEKLFRWWKKFTDFMYAFPYAIFIPIFRLQVQAIACKGQIINFKGNFGVFKSPKSNDFLGRVSALASFDPF